VQGPVKGVSQVAKDAEVLEEDGQFYEQDDYAINRYGDIEELVGNLVQEETIGGTANVHTSLPRAQCSAVMFH